ncbi:MAG: hypothetical protein IPL78_18925 [Chloroflexi bacterium]|nr:hypothetical protein [Chloroflexota bacterium]
MSSNKDNTLLIASSGDRVGQGVGITVSIGKGVSVGCSVVESVGDGIGVKVTDWEIGLVEVIIGVFDEVSACSEGVILVAITISLFSLALLDSL